MLSTMQYRFDEGAGKVFADYITRRMALPHFANARSVRNALDRARLRHASRLLSTTGAIGDDALMTIVADDLLASRVFRDDPATRVPAGGTETMPPVTAATAPPPATRVAETAKEH